MPQPPFVQRPSTRRRIMNLITTLVNMVQELGANIGVGSGTKFYVSNATGANGVDDTAHGRSRALPFATIDYAIGQCTASKGDTIIALEGHAETVNAAGFIAMDVAGVTLRGEGYGDNRPTLTWGTSTAATITMSAANCRITNMRLLMTLPSALVSGIVVSAAGCSIDNNHILVGTAGTGTAPLQAILTTAGADRLKIRDNFIVGPAATPTTIAAGTSGGICLVGGDGIEITGNFINVWATTTVGPIYGITTLTSNIKIDSNFVGNQTASSAKAIVLLTGSTGFVTNNRLGVLTGTAPITGDATWVGGNYYAAAKGVTAGTLV